jgi:hypothetical protein
MALSPNYGWAEPDNSSLVKNGAQDIRALGDAIDTSVWNVGYGQAGKNKFINGDLFVNQRAFTSTTSNAVFTFDRWVTSASDGTSTFSAQTFTPGAAPVAGYEFVNYIRVVTTGQTLTSASTIYRQVIEDVRTFAAQTITVSFWAKAATGTPKIAVGGTQSFGSGGSTAVRLTAGQVTLSTSWARYSTTIAVPSVSGKTIGSGNGLQMEFWLSAGSDFNSRTGSLGIQSNTFEMAGFQIEYGSNATPFQTASGGSPQAELAMCQRYYYAHAVGAGEQVGSCWYNSTTEADAYVKFPVTMRTAPTLVVTSATNAYAFIVSNSEDGVDSVTIFGAGTNSAGLFNASQVSGVSGTAGRLQNKLSTSSIAFSAEL